MDMNSWGTLYYSPHCAAPLGRNQASPTFPELHPEGAEDQPGWAPPITTAYPILSHLLLALLGTWGPVSCEAPKALGPTEARPRLLRFKTCFSSQSDRALPMSAPSSVTLSYILCPDEQAPGPSGPGVAFHKQNMTFIGSPVVSGGRPLSYCIKTTPL